MTMFGEIEIWSILKNFNFPPLWKMPKVCQVALIGFSTHYGPNEHISTKNPVYLNFGSRQKPKKFPWT